MCGLRSEAEATLCTHRLESPGTRECCIRAGAASLSLSHDPDPSKGGHEPPGPQECRSLCPLSSPAIVEVAPPSQPRRLCSCHGCTQHCRRHALVLDAAVDGGADVEARAHLALPVE